MMIMTMSISQIAVVLILLPMTWAMVVWPVLDKTTNTTRAAVRPKTWGEKNLGQWCRNFTVNQHTQCSQASAFHQFDCCGPNGTDCCFAIQGWVILILIIIASSSTIILTFSILLKLNLICTSSYAAKAPYSGIQN